MYQNLFLSLIFCSIHIKTTISQSQFCSTATSSAYKIRWPSTYTKTISIPPCVGKSGEFLYRDCLDGNWLSEPECFYVQPKKQPSCPDNFTDFSDICYKFTPGTDFPPNCPYEDTLPFDVYSKLIVNTEPIWMPVKRDLSDGLGFLQWIEPSWRYKTNFERNYHASNPSKGKNCLLYHNSSYIEAVSCEEKHVGVCAYKKLSSSSSKLCDHGCYQSDFSLGSKCFCRGTARGALGYPKAEFLKPYQKFHANEVCTMGLEKIPDQGYIWTHSRQELNYTSWSPNVIFDRNHRFGAVTPNGWILTEKPLKSCVLYEKEPKIPKPDLRLAFEDGRFILRVIKGKGLKQNRIFCFTNAKASSLLHRYSFHNSNSYEFEPLPDGPGEYWCEGFRYPDLEVVKSNTILFNDTQSFIYEFIAIFSLSYPPKINPLDEDIVEFIQTELAMKLDGSYCSKTYRQRIMKIVDVVEETGRITVNIHFSPKSSVNLTTTEHEELIATKESIQEKLQPGIELLSFSNYRYCATDFDNLVWLTGIVFNVDNENFCRTSEGVQPRRRCEEGNFIDGARWTVIRDCEIIEESNITPQLLPLYYGNAQNCKSLKNITQSYLKFKALDVHLAGNLLSECIEMDEEGNGDSFIEAFNNIMSVDKAVLAESESKLLSASDLLQTFYFFFYRSYQTMSPIARKNFVYAKLPFANLTGMLLQKNGKKFVARQLEGDYSLEEVIAVENLDSAILLSPEVRSQLPPSSMVSFTFFLNNSLFIENDLMPKNLPNIFSAFYDEDNVTTTEDSVWLLQRAKDNSHKICFTWLYDYKGGWWNMTSEAEVYQNFYLCKFSFAPFKAYYSIAMASTITESLNYLLQCDCGMPEIVTNLAEVSRKYYNFKAIDVHYVAKVLEKVSSNPYIELPDIVYIISNLQDVKRNVLEQCKADTDMILYHLELIIRNHEFPYVEDKVNRNNFRLAMNRMDITETSGVALLNGLPLEITEDVVGILGNSSLDMAVRFNPTAETTQMDEGIQVVIVVFLTDALFNIKPLQNFTTGKIFGVILPEAVNFSMFDRVSRTKIKKCARWLYNMPNHEAGFWQEDNDGREIEDFVKCQFRNDGPYFALLVTDTFIDKAFHGWVIANSMLSVVGLSCLAVTTLLYTKNRVLLNVAFIHILQQVVVLVAGALYENFDKICNFVAFHRSKFALFCWICVFLIVHSKNFIEYMTTSPKRILVKAAVLGWTFPGLVEIFVQLLDIYVNNTAKPCYPPGLGSYLNIWFPISLFFGINCLIYTYIVSQVTVNRCCSHCHVGNANLLKRLNVILFVVLIVIWILGCMGHLGSDFCVYLLCGAVTSQGTIIFVVFVLLDNEMRRFFFCKILSSFCFPSLPSVSRLFDLKKI